MNGYDAEEWYPFSMLIDTFRTIEKAFPSSRLLSVRAGMNFIRIWYEHGPGKEIVHSTLDWLRANDEGAGYNLVVRGGSKDEIGWSVSFRQSCKSAAALECGTAPGAGDTPWGCSSDEGKRREPPAGRRRAQGTAAGLVCRWQSADHRIDARHDQFTASPDSATASAWV